MAPILPRGTAIRKQSYVILRRGIAIPTRGIRIHEPGIAILRQGIAIRRRRIVIRKPGTVFPSQGIVIRKVWIVIRGTEMVIRKVGVHYWERSFEEEVGSPPLNKIALEPGRRSRKLIKVSGTVSRRLTAMCGGIAAGR